MLDSLNPRTGEAAPGVAATGHDDLDRMVTAAADTGPALGRSGLTERAGWLRACAAALSAEADPLVALADQETALGETRLRGEHARMVGQFQLFADVAEEGSFLDVAIDHARPEAQPAPVPDVRRASVPVGVVAAFAASNFPFAFGVGGTDTSSALAAGCPVVAKAHPAQPLLGQAIGEILARALAEAGAPPGCFGVVHGLEAGQDLVGHPRVAAVAFTGSFRGGMALRQLAAERPVPIPVYAEMGSLNPLVVTPNAARRRSDEIARGLYSSYTLGAGQFCTKPGVWLVPAGSDLAARVADLVAAAEGVGHFLAPGIAGACRATAREWAARPSVRLRAPENLPGDDADLAATPVLLEADPDVFVADPALREECFGPVALVVHYRDVEELGRVIDVLPGSLAAAVHGEDDETALGRELLSRLGRLAGRLIWNGYPTGVAVNWAIHHGGPYPATSNPLFTSVGAGAMRRFLRPVAWQNMPEELLPAALREDNPLGLPRRVDGRGHNPIGGPPTQ